MEQVKQNHAQSKSIPTNSQISSSPYKATHHKNRGSRLSEQRYTLNDDTSILEEVDQNIHQITANPENQYDFDQSFKAKHKRVNSCQNSVQTYVIQQHSRTNSTHSRNKSIYFPSNSSYAEIIGALQNTEIPYRITRLSDLQEYEGLGVFNIEHRRNVSDVDSVVYLGSEQSEFFEEDTQSPWAKGIFYQKSPQSQETVVYEPVTTTCETHQSNTPTTKNSVVEQPNIILDTSSFVTTNLPDLGSTPCGTYCSQCFMEVHTRIVFKKDITLPEGLLKLVDTILACCKGSLWMSKMRIHECSICGLELGRTQQAQQLLTLFRKASLFSP